MMRQTTTLPVWSNPADPLTPYRPGNPSNLLWNDDAAATRQTARDVAQTDETTGNLDAVAYVAFALLVVALAVYVGCRVADRVER